MKYKNHQIRYFGVSIFSELWDAGHVTHGLFECFGAGCGAERKREMGQLW